jgi:hypothetical protein
MHHSSNIVATTATAAATTAPGVAALSRGGEQQHPKRIWDQLVCFNFVFSFYFMNLANLFILAYLALS